MPVLNNFLKHSENRTKRWKRIKFFSVHEMLNATIHEASGSGRNEQYIGSCLFNPDVNRSISGLTSRVARVFLNMWDLAFIPYPEKGSAYNVDSLSALTLREPWMWAAVSHVMSCKMLNSLICTASEWHSGLWHVLKHLNPMNKMSTKVESL